MFTICCPTAAPSVPSPALTVRLMLKPEPDIDGNGEAPGIDDNGITISGPASPIKALVGCVTMPPVAP